MLYLGKLFLPFTILYPKHTELREQHPCHAPLPKDWTNASERARTSGDDLPPSANVYVHILRERRGDEDQGLARRRDDRGIEKEERQVAVEVRSEGVDDTPVAVEGVGWAGVGFVRREFTFFFQFCRDFVQQHCAIGLIMYSPHLLYGCE